MSQPIECTAVTLNVFADVPRYRRLDDRLALMAGEIARARPHFVALQEIARTCPTGDVGARLLATVNEACGRGAYRLDYAAADRVGEGEYELETGVALMSRVMGGSLQVRKFASQVCLTTTFAGVDYRLPDDRIALRRTCRLSAETAIDVYVTHLTDKNELSEDGALIRVDQARELVEWIKRASAPETHVILAGDLNDVPRSETVATLLGAGFIDVYAVAGVPPGYTNDRNDIDLEDPVASHNQRIDYLFLRPGRSRRYEVVEGGLFADRPRLDGTGSHLWLSDHIGVRATVRLW